MYINLQTSTFSFCGRVFKTSWSQDILEEIMLQMLTCMVKLPEINLSVPLT